MALPSTIDQSVILDGVAGGELARLEAWVLTWFKEKAAKTFQTIDRWRGQVDLDAVKRESFRCPALFLAMDGSAGQTGTSGGVVRPDVRFKAVIVTRNQGRQNLNNPGDRYLQGVALSGIVWRMLQVMCPADDDPYTRPHSIQFKNNYTKKLDKLGVSLWAFTWLHQMHIGDIDETQLDDLLTVFGQLYPNNPDKDTVPTEGQVDYTP